MSGHGFFKKNLSLIIYGVSLAILIFLLKWMELRFVIFSHSFEIYVGLIALLFTGLGIWLAIKLSKPKIETIVVKKEVHVSKDDFVADIAKIQELNISNRELEVLELMANGYSNQEIAEKVFVSLSTIKTHNQNLFLKLNVKRRTQAVAKARELNIIA